MVSEVTNEDHIPGDASVSDTSCDNDNSSSSGNMRQCCDTDITRLETRIIKTHVLWGWTHHEHCLDCHHLILHLQHKQSDLKTLDTDDHI